MYYALEDRQNGGNLMHTGRNSRNLAELRAALLSYIKPDIEEEDRATLQAASVNDLAEWWDFDITAQDKPYEEGLE